MTSTRPVYERVAAVAGLQDGARLSRTRLFDLLAEDVEWWVAGPTGVIGAGGTAHATCSGGSPTATARPAAASYEEYRMAACAVWDALFRAVPERAAHALAALRRRCPH
jgi:hypothetical protein